MSKIEDALKRAKAERRRSIAARGGDYLENFDTDDDVDGVESNYPPPAVVKFQPQNRAELSDNDLQRNRIINPFFPEEPLSAFKLLRTRLLQRTPRGDGQIIAVSSPADGDGKTITAINLAISLALHGGHSVVLLDLDFRKPSVAAYLGLSGSEIGVNKLYRSGMTLNQILWDVGIENLYVAPNWEMVENSSELLLSKKTREVFGAIRRIDRAAITVVDLPPVLSADDAVAIGPLVDLTLLIVAQNETRRGDVAKAVELLSETTEVAPILNKVSVT